MTGRPANAITQAATNRLDNDPPRIRWVRRGMTWRGVVDYDPGQDIEGCGNNSHSHHNQTTRHGDTP